VFYDKRHDPKVHEWYFGMMNDPDKCEKFKYTDAIYDYKNIVAELEKLYEQRPASDRYMRARIQSGLKESKRELAKILLNIGCLRNTKQELQ
jgi:hypothetical protein